MRTAQPSSPTAQMPSLEGIDYASASCYKAGDVVTLRPEHTGQHRALCAEEGPLVLVVGTVLHEGCTMVKVKAWFGSKGLREMIVYPQMLCTDVD